MARTTTYEYTQFSYNKATDTFAGEASELRGGGIASFYIRGKTSEKRLFLFERHETCGTADNELVAWHYISPGNGHRAVVFND